MLMTTVDARETELRRLGLRIVRDKDLLAPGQLRPKYLGDAIEHRQAVVPVWSVSSAASKSVAIEGPTALANKKAFSALGAG
jgi:hypothetical protein